MNKKKSKKKTAIIVILILVALAVAIFFGVRHFLYNNLSSEEEEIIHEEVGQITEKVLGQIEREKTESSDPDTLKQAEEFIGEVETGQIKTGKNGPSEAQIDAVVARYYGGMQTLQSQAYGKVNDIMNEAKAHYLHARIEEGKSKIQALSELSGYVSRAYAMEASFDASVSTLMSNMRGELKSIGTDKAIIDKYVSAFNGKYEGAKAQIRALAAPYI